MLDRRTVMKSLAGLPLAALLADPKLARAAAETLETVTLTTGDGRTVTAALALPKTTPAPVVVLIHEWTGLNDYVKTMAHAFAREGYVALAVDLYDGKVAANVDEAKQFMQTLNPDHATETLKSWIAWAYGSKHGNGKVATCGWCFGGGWSLNASIAHPVDATVIYYGKVTRPAADLKALKGPVLGHFGTLDKSINAEMVAGFEKEMSTAGKADTLTVHWYEANHAFANASGGRYDEPSANLAWTRTMEFLKKTL